MRTGGQTAMVGWAESKRPELVPLGSPHQGPSLQGQGSGTDAHPPPCNLCWPGPGNCSLRLCAGHSPGTPDRAAAATLGHQVQSAWHNASNLWHLQLEEHVAEPSVPAFPVGGRPLQRCAPHPARCHRRCRHATCRRRHRAACCRRRRALSPAGGPCSQRRCRRCCRSRRRCRYTLLRCPCPVSPCILLPLPLRRFLRKRLQAADCQARLRACRGLAAAAASARTGATADTPATDSGIGFSDQHGGQRDVCRLLPLAHACGVAAAAACANA